MMGVRALNSSSANPGHAEGASLPEAKTLVDASSAWADRLASNERLRQEAVEIFLKWAESDSETACRDVQCIGEQQQELGG